MRHIDTTKKCNYQKKPLAFTYIFGSFFAAVMIAAAFAYFNFKFSTYRFIDFSQLVLYNNRQTFKPNKPYYTVIIFSSNASYHDKITNIKSTYPILAIDIHQKPPQVRDNPNNNIYIIATSGINTLLQIIQRFNIYTLPSVFVIKQQDGFLYKQDSGIDIL